MPFAQKLAKVKSGRRIRPPLVGSALALRMQKPKNFCQRRDQAASSGQRPQRSSFGVFDLLLGRAGRLETP